MNKENDTAVKEGIREFYGRIVEQPSSDKGSCCAPGSCCSGGEVAVESRFHDDYSGREGYLAEADYGLGCGSPLDFGRAQTGETVLDLGSGAGNDAFLARAQVGDSGRVIGVDFTPAMVEKARSLAESRGYHNVEFRLGDIEKLPLAPGQIDLVISNCVLNLATSKSLAFGQMFRTLRPLGRIAISDIVLLDELPDSLRQITTLVAGCVSGAIRKEEYLGLLGRVGFENVEVVKDTPYEFTFDQISSYVEPDHLQQLRRDFGERSLRLASITVTATKPVYESCGCGGAC